MSPNPCLSDWREQRVWVIGASSGIGEALATQLASAGARLALSARREEVLWRLAREEDRVFPLDVADAKAVADAHQAIVTEWGGIDLVIYCAGVYTPMRSWELDLDKAKESMQINLAGVYNLLHLSLIHI